MEKVSDSVKRADYVWLADGRKMGVLDNEGNGYMYLGSLVYTKHNGGSWELESAEFDGGRFLATTSSSSGFSGRNCTPYYQLADHLGSVRTVFTLSDGLAQIVAQNDYYPFGLRHASDVLSHGSSTDNRYLFNGKEAQVLGRLGLLDYGARMYDPLTGRWFNVDPLAKLYYGISPFVYCANNPVKFVDQDGRKIKIWYKDQNGKDKSYVYSGGKTAVENTFVDQVVTAYHYNKQNSDGKNPMTKAVEGDHIIGIVENNDTRYWSVTETVYWNPELGLQTGNTVLSPATSADHEFDHAMDDANSPDEHSERVSTRDSQYDSKEERRVITGSEQRTARANGETKGNLPTRTNHRGKSVIVKDGVTSTLIDPVKTQEYEKRQK